jgi:O-antigen ligase
MRLFAFQTLSAIILFLGYYAGKSKLTVRNLIILSLGFVALVVLYRSYSKAAVLIVILWFIIWTLSYRRIVPALLLAGLAAVISAIYYDQIAQDITKLFSKELAAAEREEVDAWTFRRTLGGRVFSWYEAVENFVSRPLFQQVFGDGNPANIHNDYLAKLLSGGVVGLLI